MYKVIVTKVSGKESTSTKSTFSTSSDKVYTQEDLAKVLFKAKQYKTLYKEADKQVNLLQDRMKVCTDNNLMLANEILDRIITLENELSTFRAEQVMLKTELQSVTEQLAKEKGTRKKEDGDTTEKDQKTRERGERNDNGATNTKPDHHTSSDDTGDSSFVIGGLIGLRKFYHAPRVDPAQLIRNVLYDLWIPCAHVKISIADKTASDARDRQKARAMIVTMRTPKQKKDAIQKIKRYLLQWGIEETSVEDYFPNHTLSKAKKLRGYAAELKREGKIHGYRVINVQGTVVLQTCQEGEAYESIDESHIDLSNQGAEQAEGSSTQETSG